MTALKKYQRLESGGLWRETPAAQRREVVVGFRDATLILSDPRTQVALSHWSLPAVERLNPGDLPAVFGPGYDAHETLELDDPDMIAALTQVRGAVDAAIPRPGRLRATLVLGGTALILGLLVLVGPGVLVRHTAGVVPEPSRRIIGDQALAALQPLTGQPCSTEPADQALARLSLRLWGKDSPWRLHIARDGVTGTLLLPGHILLIDRRLTEEAPEVFAGFALAHSLGTEDPLEPLLRHAGLGATFALLTKGNLPDKALTGYGEVLLRSPTPPPDPVPLLALFDQAEVPSTPYALALDPTGETTLPLIEADPHRGGAEIAVMPGADWLAVQGACG
ncbi:hypothetical protein [Neogemmobacter tilapiae]|uniref:Uncharacterized protein n=1 Tax=Neogemmobacter tilapiae TaxID=875041 RepID=A0A918TMH2_9RHOB|nr:hypothetical protein [Gemmobacter tilapiae]GHC48586.1 hypothetical protein GCM10007315_08270 [Gemmobacter tilapiae]